PDGVAREIFGDIRCLLLAPRLLVLQVAHPVVGAGVADHSDFRSDPWGRLLRTLLSLTTVVHGTPEEARAEARRLRRLHAAMTGIDEYGRPYRALDPGAYAWVHATLVMGPLDTMALFGAPVTGDRLETYHRELRGVGRMWGIAEHRLPPDPAAFNARYAEIVTGELGDNRAVREVLDALSHPAPPVPRIPAALWGLLTRPVTRRLTLVTVGTLPPELRERLGLSWTPRDERDLRRFAHRVRLLVEPLPVRFRVFLPPLLLRLAAHRRARAERAARRAERRDRPRSEPPRR
ncbi:oxygenase MpaB family protein, partial [Streptomyces alkaliphilus]|uniref:oxygenase MpaB family protein n=1 Tax=Streptomyces alkaliphilus TaxID=1472722 RepID=UPI001888FF09